MKITPTVPEHLAIRRRQELLEGSETIRGLLFQAITESVKERAGLDVAAATLAEAGLAGRDFDKMSKYPMTDFLRYEEAAANAMQEALTFDEAIHGIGAKAVEIFFDSIAGRTMALLAGKDPTRLLGAVPNGYELLVSYGRREWRRTGPNRGVFAFHGELLGPVHTCGIFDTALKIAHGVDATIELESRSPIDFNLIIGW